MESKGLGDTIEKLTQATGIKDLTKKIVGDDCGCGGRKRKLNDLLPYSTEEKKTRQWHI
jgi:hypothetical protein